MWLYKVIIYVKCIWNNCSEDINLSSWKRRTWKNSGLKGIWTYDLFDTGITEVVVSNSIQAWSFSGSSFSVVVLALSKRLIRNTPPFLTGHVFCQCQVSSGSYLLYSFISRIICGLCWLVYPPSSPMGLIFSHICLFSKVCWLPQTSAVLFLCLLILPKLISLLRWSSALPKNKFFWGNTVSGSVGLVWLFK